MKSKIISNNNISSKKDQDIKDKELIINDLKERSDNWINLVKEREKIINEQSSKIKELSELINRKDEQLKLMVNFSKEINKENKSNVQELTKQAVKTIKIFYNSLNNSPYNDFDSGNKIEFKNESFNKAKFEEILKNKKISFLLEDGLNGMMYIPPGVKSISKEFLMDMNFKTELIKGELLSGIIREIHFVYFLEQIFDKLNINDTNSIKNICVKVIELKIILENLLKENNYIKKINHILKENVMQNNLSIQKLKENADTNLKKLKEKYMILTMNMDTKIKNAKNKNIVLKEKAKKDSEKLKEEIKNLKNEINRIKKENFELKRKIEIDNIKDNEKLMKSFEKEMENENKDNKDNWNDFNQIENINNFNYIGIKINNNKDEINEGLNDNKINDTNNLENNIIKVENQNKLDNNRFNNNLNPDFIDNNNVVPNNFENNININPNINNIDNNINNMNNKDEYNNKKNNSSNNIILQNNMRYDESNSNNKIPFKINLNLNKIALNNKENINTNGNNTDRHSNTEREMINNELLKNYNLKLQEILDEKAKEKEINNNKVQELQNLLNDEQNKNTILTKEINSLKSYSEELKKNISLLEQNQKENQNKINKKKIFTPQLFIKLFFKINHKIFSSSEYKKYIQIYNLKDIYSVYETFKKTCDLLKKQVYETHFEIDTTSTNTEMDENFFNNSTRAFINSSYKAVNERILKLKKFEFDVINLNEFIKNYLISQEIIIQMIFNGNNNVIQFDIIEKLFKLLEECLKFKIDEMNDNLIFQRKLIIKYLKSQKNCLGLSLEYLTSS